MSSLKKREDNQEQEGLRRLSQSDRSFYRRSRKMISVANQKAVDDNEGIRRSFDLQTSTPKKKMKLRGTDDINRSLIESLTPTKSIKKHISNTNIDINISKTAKTASINPLNTPSTEVNEKETDIVDKILSENSEDFFSSSPSETLIKIPQKKKRISARKLNFTATSSSKNEVQDTDCGSSEKSSATSSEKKREHLENYYKARAEVMTWAVEQAKNMEEERRKSSSSFEILSKLASEGDTLGADSHRQQSQLSSHKYRKDWRRQAEGLLEDKLLLPQKYENLLKRFDALESVLMFHRGRKQSHMFFNELRKPVERICRLNFETKHLGQVLMIMPDAFEVILSETSTKGSTSETFEDYKISTNFGEEESNEGMLSGSLSQKRKKEFEAVLFEIVHAGHQEFLNIVNPKLHSRMMKTWHSKFPLEEIPSIPSVLKEIPSIKEQSRQKTQTMISELLNRKKTATIDSPSQQNSDLQKQSMSVLERVRMRMSRKMKDAEGKGPILRGKLRKLDKLEGLVSCMRSMIITSNGRDREYNTFLVNLSKKIPNRDSVTIGELKEEVEMIINMIPSWCEKKTLSSGLTIIKIDTSMNLNEVRGIIRKEKNKLRDEIESLHSTL